MAVSETARTAANPAVTHTQKHTATRQRLEQYDTFETGSGLGLATSSPFIVFEFCG
jgi:hypothetical protein